MATSAESLSLADRLRLLRERARLSQSALADRSGISLSLVSKLEQGQTGNPRVNTLRAIAKVLSVTLDELAGE